MLTLIEDLGIQFKGYKQKVRWYLVRCSKCNNTTEIRASTFKSREYCKDCATTTGTQEYEGYKVCSMCEIKKEITKFYTRKDSTDGFRSHCIDCIKTYSSAKWRGDDSFRERGTLRSRKYSLKVNYGLTISEFNRMNAAVNYSCEICGVSVENLQTNNLAIDHCHETGVIRGLLCNPCNTALAYFKDDKDILKKAIDYLSKDRQGWRKVPTT